MLLKNVFKKIKNGEKTMKKKNNDIPNMKNGGNPLNNPFVQKQMKEVGAIVGFKQLLAYGLINTLAEKTKSGFIPLSEADGTEETEQKVVYDTEKPFEMENAEDLGGKYYPIAMDILYEETEEGKYAPTGVETYYGEDELFSEICYGLKILAFIDDNGEDNYIQIMHPKYTNYCLYIQDGIFFTQ